jgi:hypothetical protein
MKFRSKFEKRIWDNADKRRKLDYEPDSARLPYVTASTYIPDFRLGNGILVEAKGYLKPKDRGKMLRVKKQNPDADIRFLFQRANNRITKSKNSLMYWEWAEKHGFPWAEGDYIPDAWFKEEKKK